MTNNHEGRTDHQQARPDDVSAVRRTRPDADKPDQLHEEERPRRER